MSRCDGLSAVIRHCIACMGPLHSCMQYHLTFALFLAELLIGFEWLQALSRFKV